MDILSVDELKALISERADFCVSLFMPVHRTGETQQDPIRLKNLLNQAEEKMAAAGGRPAAARALLQPVRDATQKSLFWQGRSDGLAVFASMNTVRWGHLPYRFEERVAVSERFVIKPLLPVVSGGQRFYILAISQNRVRLFLCTRYTTGEVDLSQYVPTSRDDALRYDEFQKVAQYFTGAAATGGGSAIQFQGQAVGDTVKDSILRYFREVDKGLHRLLVETFKDERAPLVFAGVEYLLPIYRQANTHPLLMADGIPGNPEGVNPENLCREGWKSVQPYFDRAQKDSFERYNDLVGKGLTSTDVRKIVPAAREGRVGTLFVATVPEVWGAVTGDGRVEVREKPQPGDQDLLDYAAVQTIANSGVVYAVPGDKAVEKSAVAAILRYQV